MAITKRTEIGSMNILPLGSVEVRTDTVIEEDGVELSRTYHRHIVQPDQSDMTKEDKRVQDVATLVHTPAIKTAWVAKKAADAASIAK